ncbi:MAG: NAD(P)H-hydrate dehydratase [Aquificaceae bacterium]|jgi:NAD(P)H-hydrate epimerase|uniref:NAD(P)H-hydrate dehydratase n=1 Tax=Hydrogenobacter sp. Uz 6-8 TaxID=3384828 RepID=UPI0030B0CB6E
MKLLKAREMQDMDTKAIQELGIPSLLLMEKAGLSVVEVIRREFPQARRVLVVAGKGNNGGDGLVVARHLHMLGYRVGYFLALGEELRGDAQLQLKILRNLGLEPMKGLDFEDFDLLVDALFGTGFEPPVKGQAVEVIRAIDQSGLPVISVDIPSGLSADSGREFEPSVKARVTVTFQFPKLCHLLHPASKRCGKLYVANIGIPHRLAEGINREVLTEAELPEREPDVHKGRMGHVLLMGGSVGKTGAVIMSAKSATSAGAGLVSVGVPEGLNHILEIALTEEMSLPLRGERRLSKECLPQVLELQEKCSAVGVGMGMDRYEEGRHIIKGLIEGIEKPLLIDADGLNNLADLGVEVLRERKGITVLTPHVGEFERLSGLEKSYIVENLVDVAVDFSVRYGCYVVLKSSRTAIATPEGKVYLSVRGTPAMAKGGVGDVLAGILTALIGRGMPVEWALKLGVFLHGLAGELAEKRKHRETLKALDLVESLPSAFRLIESRAYSQAFEYLL